MSRIRKVLAVLLAAMLVTTQLGSSAFADTTTDEQSENTNLELIEETENDLSDAESSDQPEPPATVQSEEIAASSAGISPLATNIGGTHGSLSWYIDGDGHLTITGSGTMSGSIPPDYNNAWNAHKNDVKKITIGEGITSIGGNAFATFKSLTEVVLPTSLTSIGTKAFMDCGSIKSIKVLGSTSGLDFELPSNLSTIGALAFDRAFFTSGISQIAFTLPASVSSVGSQAFNLNAKQTTYHFIITVEASSASGYASDAFVTKGDGNSTKTVVAFSDKSAFDSFSQVGSKYAKSSYTYPVEVNYYDSIDATTPETKYGLTGKSVYYAKDSSGNWFYDANYSPGDSSESGDSDPGYTVNWVTFPGNDITAASEKITEDTIVYKNLNVYKYKTINNPTVTGTLDGSYYIDGVPSKGWLNFIIDIPDNRMSRTPYVEVGVNVEHPLLKGDGTDGHYGNESDGYVYFKYGWVDIERVDFGGGASDPGDGRRKMDYPFQNSGSGFVSDNSITIENDSHLRKPGSSDIRYEVVVLGYYVKEGTESVFYLSSDSSLSYTSLPYAGVTDSTTYAIYTDKKETTVTFDLKGGSIEGDSTSVVWNPLYRTSSNVGYDTLSEYPDSIPEPTYGTATLFGWKNTATGQVISPDKMADELILAGTLVDGSMLWNQVYEAQWSDKLRINYQYTTDGGSTWTSYTDYSNEEAGSALPDSLIVRPAEDPRLDGYGTFDGWYTDKNFTTEWDYSTDKIADESITLYGKMNPINYDIEYRLDGGTNRSDNPDTYAVTDLDIELKDPTKAGYTFAGWTVELENVKTDDLVFEDSTIKKGTFGNLIATAKWTPKDVVITYYPGYGVNDAYTSTDITNLTAASHGSFDGVVTGPVFYGSSIKPVREGYVFMGWTQLNTGTNWTFSDQSNPTTLTFANGVVSDSSGNHTLKLTAQWKLSDEYVITYDYAGGSLTAPAVNPLSYTVADLEISLNVPHKEGSVFAGWTAELTVWGQGKLVFDKGNDGLGGTIKKGTYGDLKFTANWDENPVEVTYYSGYGNNDAYSNADLYNPKKAAEGTYGGTLDFPIFNDSTSQDITQKPVREGYTFVGWKQVDENIIWVFNDKSSPTELLPANGIVADSNNNNAYTLALTAQWEPTTYKVTFDSQGSDQATTLDKLVLSIGFEEVISTNKDFPSSPTKDGYTFLGWRMDDGATLENTVTQMPAHDVHLTAVWKETGPGSIIAYDFTHNYDSGELTVADVNTKAGPVVYDAAGNPTGETPTFPAATLDSLNSVINAMNYDKTAKVQITYTSQTGNQVTVTATIVRGPGPVVPPPEPPEPEVIVITETVYETVYETIYETLTEVITLTETEYVEVPGENIETIVTVETEKEVIKENNTSSNTDNTSNNTQAPAAPQTIVVPAEDDGFIFTGEDNVVYTNIFGNAVPLASELDYEYWSIVSLALTIIGGILAVVHLLLGFLRRKRKDEDSSVQSNGNSAYVSALEARNSEGATNDFEIKRKRNWTAMRTVAIVLAVLAVILLFVLEDYTLSAAWINQYTPVFIVLFIGVVVGSVVHIPINYKKKKDEQREYTEMNKPAPVQ